MPAPTAAPRTIRRLDTLGKPGDRPKPKPKAKPQKAACCDTPDIQDDDGMKVCVNCGTQISESNIVSDVTFQEDSRGAATVQGGFIGENARHARTLGTGAYRKVGGGERNSMQEIENNGRRALSRLCPRLNIPDAVSLQAQNLFSIAAGNNFNAGRRTEEVVAACLYAACRRQKQNTIMLMDIAEIMKVNVFRLGEVYKAMKENLHYHDQTVGVQHLTDVEPLIEKYCRKLEFGDKTRNVAEDAVKIIKRMKRDWMVTGRHPAGLCGACIILAARMNNFRRSVREVVYVAKVSDATIAKRVEEFRQTKASTLTVEQFREYGSRLKYSHDPPIMQQKALEKEKFEAKKRKRQEYNEQRDTVDPERETIEISDDEDDASSRAPSATPGASAAEEAGEEERQRKRQRANAPQATPAVTQGPRIDADGFAIPALPVVGPAPVEQSEETQVAKKKRGRRRKGDKPEPVQITEADLTVERELEDEIDEALNDQELQDSHNEIERAKAEERIKLLADQQRQSSAEKIKERREAEGVTWWADKEPNTGDGTEDMDLEAEFADDPEVLNCMLSDVEARIKEQIWIAHNEDWLRSQHEKALIKQIAEAAGADKEKSKRGAKGKKKRGRIGDGTVLTEAETPIETPADANAAMLKKRAAPNFSKFVDYERLAAVYGDRATPDTSASQSRAGSEAASQAPSRVASEAPSAHAGAERSSATPAPQERTVAFSLPSPQATQQAAVAPGTPSRVDAAEPQAPASPPPTQAQAQATEGAEDEDADMVDDEEGDYRSPTPSVVGGWDDAGSDREDIGEDDNGDYGRAIGHASFGTFGGEDDEYV
ncbi:hypothetical protein LTR36_008252 [Oleoguttula mirabilis]|uniref:Cyclin-like domain-containing protein n=1 Tax=Oleoguttula mirabilis TaxID=1507867 RepID=A0AAV9J819_9PEZI|nr:hypothetical protein LTR36_008252 [Oleoguttula mirabilis]